MIQFDATRRYAYESPDLRVTFRFGFGGPTCVKALLPSCACGLSRMEVMCHTVHLRAALCGSLLCLEKINQPREVPMLVTIRSEEHVRRGCVAWLWTQVNFDKTGAVVREMICARRTQGKLRIRTSLPFCLHP